MKKISKEIALLLKEKKYFDESMIDVYVYGIQMLFEVMISLIASIIICLTLKMPVEGLIFFIIFIPLRSYLGGIHMKTFIGCFICSCLTLLIILLLVKFVFPAFIISLILFIASTLYILYEAYIYKKTNPKNRYFSRICFIIIICIILYLFFAFLNLCQYTFLITCTFILIAISKSLEQIIQIKQK